MWDIAFQLAATLGTMLFFALIPILIYCLRSGGSEFSWHKFILDNRPRWVWGFLIMAILSIGVTVWPESRQALNLAANLIAGFLGIGGGITQALGLSDFSLGLIVGGLLVAAINSEARH